MNPSTDGDLEAQAGDAILDWIIRAVPKVNNYSYILQLAEAYALVTGTLTSKGSQVKVEK